MCSRKNLQIYLDIVAERQIFMIVKSLVKYRQLLRIMIYCYSQSIIIVIFVFLSAVAAVNTVCLWDRVNADFKRPQIHGEKCKTVYHCGGAAADLLGDIGRAQIYVIEAAKIK